MWLILDRAQEDSDRKLAEHVLTVHSEGAAPVPESELHPITPRQLRTYIALAKQHAPRIPKDLTDYVAAVYAEMRRQEAMSDRPHSYTTPRTLLSILRLSQALAKLRFDDKVRCHGSRTARLSCGRALSPSRLCPARVHASGAAGDVRGPSRDAT
jgi:DNA replication licensing factor MCM7